MAVVRSLEGTFFDIPESELDKYKVPADQVKGLMEASGQKPPQNPGQQQVGQGSGQGQGGSPQILVQFIMPAPGAAQPKQGQAQGQKPQAEGEEESVEPQWYWMNWNNFHWNNWHNWHNWNNWY